MSVSRTNPFDPTSCSSTLYAMTGLFLGTSLLKDVKKMPDRSDARAFNAWFDSFKDWLALFIRNTQDGLTPIGDIERKMELIDVLKASLKPAEIQDLDAPLTKLKESFAKIQETRNAIREQNGKFNTSFQKEGSEILKMSSHQPEIGKSKPAMDVLKRQTESQRLLNLSVTRVREMEERIRAEAKVITDALTRRVAPEKVRELEEKVQEATSRPELGSGGG